MTGALIIIGGHEAKEGRRPVLREIARRVRGGRLVIATVASHRPEGYFDSYRAGFAELGVGELVELYVQDRSETLREDKLAVLEGAAGVFFTGGDQLRITSQIGDTPVEQRIRALFEAGAVIAGTSAGASVMSDTMMVGGTSSESHRIGDLRMAPGLGFVRDVIIDQHFAQRGRFGRLLGAVAHNPRVLGMGVDEDTALVVEGTGAKVVGSGAVYVIDGAGVTHSNIAEARPERPLSIFDVRTHVLAAGDSFDLARRRPTDAPELEQSQALEAQGAGRGGPEGAP